MDSEKLDVLCDALRIQSKNITVSATIAVNSDTEAKKVNSIALAMNAIRELCGIKGQIMEEITVSEEELKEVLECVGNDFELLSENLDRDLVNAVACGKNGAIYYIDGLIKTIEMFGMRRKNLENLKEMLKFEEEENDNQ